MQKFMSMAEVKAMIDPEKEMFTREELMQSKLVCNLFRKSFTGKKKIRTVILISN